MNTSMKWLKPLGNMVIPAILFYIAYHVVGIIPAVIISLAYSLISAVFFTIWQKILRLNHSN